MQPSYIPWLGHFDQINKSNIFVFFDDVQYTRRDWRNRNKIKLLNGETRYLTIPIKSKGNYDALIKDIEISYQDNWTSSHLGIIRDNYKKTPFFEPIFSLLKNIINKKFQLLSDLNIELTKAITEYLEIKHVKFYKSSELKIEPYSDPTDHLVKICQNLKGTRYLSGDSAKSYINEQQFKNANIELLYHGYEHPSYRQEGNIFVPYLSIIDLLFNEGENSLKIFKKPI